MNDENNLNLGQGSVRNCRGWLSGVLVLTIWLGCASTVFAESSSVVVDADVSGKMTAKPTDAATAEKPTVALPVTVKVLDEPLADKPISPLLYGNFIELGFGSQIDGMWAEMLYNRSFEDWPKPPDGKLAWLGRSLDEDLSNEPWWHNGYERAPWLATGEAGKYVWNPSWRYWMRHGMQQATLDNTRADTAASFYQTGLVVRAGMTYHFHGQLKCGGIGQFTGPEATVTVGLYEGGLLAKPLVTQPVKIQSAWAEYACDLPVGDYAGRATFAVSVPAGQTVHADALSLMPADNVHGWHLDVLAALKRVNIGLIRFPGGCFASTYNWRDGVGPELERMPRPSYAWTDFEYNDVGTAEFVTLCRLIHAEPFLCVNVMTGHAEDAAEWVAYCNAPTNTPMGAMRARHGFPEPFNVKYWELDNEDFRKYSPDEYAVRAVEFTRLMKAVDPTIKVAMCGYWDLVPGFRAQLAGMLDIAGKDIDLVARREFGSGGLQQTMKVLDAYNQKTGRDIRLCNTEYFPEGRPVPYLDSSEHREPTLQEKNFQHQLIRWGWSLNIARTLFNFRTLGGDLEFTCFNNLANTWGQNVIECSKEGAYLSANGRVFEFLSRSAARWPVRVETKEKPVDGTAVWACLTADKHGVVVSFLNELSTPWPVTVDLSALGLAGEKSGKLVSLSAQDRTVHVTLTTQDVIKRAEHTVPVNAGGTTVIEVPPCSVSELTL